MVPSASTVCNDTFEILSQNCSRQQSLRPSVAILKSIFSNKVLKKN